MTVITEDIRVNYNSYYIL